MTKKEREVLQKAREAVNESWNKHMAPFIRKMKRKMAEELAAEYFTRAGKAGRGKR